MGTPTPPVPPPGDPCAFCDGLLWPIGTPPGFLEVDLWDLVKCVGCPIDPPNGKWWLEQQAGYSSHWLYADSLYLIEVWLDAVNSYIIAGSAAGPPWWDFFADTRAGCQYSFVNDWTACGGNVGSINGETYVHWPGP